MAGILKVLSGLRVPIVSELFASKVDDIREALKEIIVVLVFSLMPLWLGLFIASVVKLSFGAAGFLDRFAASSDMGILSASLLGPLIYTLFRDYEPLNTKAGLSRFPSAIWFVVITIICCVMAATLYCFVYVSESQTFYDSGGKHTEFMNFPIVKSASWVLLVVAVVLIMAASAIRNSLERRIQTTPQVMSDDTTDYLDELREQQAEAAEGAAPAADAQPAPPVVIAPNEHGEG